MTIARDPGFAGSESGSIAAALHKGTYARTGVAYRGFKRGQFPVAESVFERLVTLPSHPT